MADLQWRRAMSAVGGNSGHVRDASLGPLKTQSGHRPRARPRGAADAARPRRRGDRI